MSYFFHSSLFREYDIRGTFHQTLLTQDAYEIGIRMGTYLKNTQIPSFSVCVGYDGRLSSPTLKTSLIHGLRDSGTHVLDIGVGPTPMLYYATKMTQAIAGIMVTGSHNPPDDNGFKITLKESPFFGSQLQDLKELLPRKSQTVGTLETIDISHSYINCLLSGFSPLPSSKKLKVAWDCGNGASGEIIDRLTPLLPHSSLLLNTIIDGTFPAHHPDPTEEKNMDQLKKTVLKHHCDIGIAFDGDGDRMGVVDEKGRMIWGDQLLCLFAQALLKESLGAKIIADIKSSQSFFDSVIKWKGIPLMGKTGHSHIKKMMKETDAPLAGEMSGHFFFADRYHGYDDGLYASLRLLEILEKQEKTLGQLFDDLPQYHNTPEIRLPCKDEEKFNIITQIQGFLTKKGVDFLNIDGIRVTTKKGWWLIRASNTQSMLVMRCETYQKEDLIPLFEEVKQILDPYLIMPSMDHMIRQDKGY